ncbi:MAG: hypothetical protein LBG80_13870, partial [Bacteroidales bacterium]|nr:hypothetical protein [Bacteroidales bacterium]
MTILKKQCVVGILFITIIVGIGYYTYWYFYWQNLSYSPGIIQALKQAGQNHTELQKVLEHYNQPKDSLKLKTAHFLIENMSEKYSKENRPIENYQTMFDEWLKLKIKYFYIDSKTSDSMVMAYGLTSQQKRLSDLQHIKASYLINNIDRSFEVWASMPWGKNVPFDVFCEEILPYRISTEPLENWRDIVLEQYRTLYDSLRTSNVDVMTACIRIFEAMGMEWDSVNKLSDLLPSRNYSMLNHVRTGPCTERVKYGIFVMRAFGIPVSWDYTPQWPFRNMGHSWVSVRNTDEKYIPFIPAELKPGDPHKPDHRMAKAFRHTYSLNKQSLAYISKSKYLPYVFRNMFIRDVSSHTFSASDIVINSKFFSVSKCDFIYLSVFDNQSWVPIQWAKMTNPAVFVDMGKNISYLPVTYKDGVIVPCGTPFIFTSQAKIRWLKADTTRRQSLRLIRKHPFLANWDVKMVGGQFQGANREDFSDAVLLYTIEKDPDFYYCNIPIHETGIYRYYRYVLPKEGTGPAELGFYEGKDTVRITGKIIGTSGSYQGMPSRTINKAFDGDVLT